jgi:hypothetical protein
MSRAGCTPQEIAAVSGHSVETIHRMLAIYNPPDTVQADHAVVKLEAYRARLKKQLLEETA